MNRLFHITILALIIPGFSLAQLEVRPLDPRSVKQIKVVGEVVEGRQWKDANGENIVVLTRTEPVGNIGDTYDQELHAYAFVQRDGVGSILWQLLDYERECEFDLTVEFISEGLQITDLDNDEIAEVWVVYKTACRSDVSPASMKIIMHEGAEKYAVRGETKFIVNMDDEGNPVYGGGDKKFGLEWAKASNAFKNYANALYEKLSTE